MFYRALGFAVWTGVKWYLGQRKRRSLPPAKLLVAGAVAAAVATAIGIGARRDASHGD